MVFSRAFIPIGQRHAFPFGLLLCAWPGELIALALAGNSFNSSSLLIVGGGAFGKFFVIFWLFCHILYEF